MIRPATEDDIPQLLDMGDRFAAKARLVDSVGYVARDMAETFAAMIRGGHPVFIGENGAIGGTSLPHPFNKAHIMAHELFWWSEGREGLALFKAFDAWCAEHCHSLRMITLHAIEPEKTGRLYERLGFTPLEHSYVKVY